MDKISPEDQAPSGSGKRKFDEIIIESTEEDQEPSSKVQKSDEDTSSKLFFYILNKHTLQLLFYS